MFTPVSPQNLAPVARFKTAGDVVVHRRVKPLLRGENALTELAERLDHHRGMVMACDINVPGRYTPLITGFEHPPLVLTGRGETFSLEALNPRGEVLLPAFQAALERESLLQIHAATATALNGRVRTAPAPEDEDKRLRQPSLMTVVRCLRAVLDTPDDPYLGLYGTFGYDLALQIDPITRRLPRPADQRDLVLFLPDRIVIEEPLSHTVTRVSYEFEYGDTGTAKLDRSGPIAVVQQTVPTAAPADDAFAPGAYAKVVESALQRFRAGDLFEVVPSQTFHRPCPLPPSALFARLRHSNPAPFGLLANLGEGEALISASPEMFVRSDGHGVETAPISGTIARGDDALGDADAILTLLASAKEAAELTMCTDVDRNDKARVCVPGSVRIVGRRQIELYSRLIHTVDHVVGTLRPDRDALDGFLAHAWAVTVTGAPKKGAMQFIENHERSSRRWYGGAFGAVLANGSLNTGLTLRTIRLCHGQAEVRAGATVLIDSDPAAEDRECHLKASALMAVLDAATPRPIHTEAAPAFPHFPKRVVMVDHEDSFVHTLGDYFRRFGAEVTVVRQPMFAAQLEQQVPDLVVLSPGPGRPADFHLSDTIALAQAKGCAIFGVCLGLQGIVEHFGGSLDVGTACHGRSATVDRIGDGGRLLSDLPPQFRAGRYHSLHARPSNLPDCLRITAAIAAGHPDAGMIMAVEHTEAPIAAVQFHPESLLSLHDDLGQRLIARVLERL